MRSRGPRPAVKTDPVLPDQGGRMLADPDTAASAKQAIRNKAYEIYLSRGKSEGRDLDYWLEAEALIEDAAARTNRNPQADAPSASASDPVCGMEVFVGSAPSTEYRGTTYYFCSMACLGTFTDNPKPHVAGAA